MSQVSGRSAIRLIAIALLAGTAAGCSSDVSRFMSQGTDGITTASVPAPESTRLAPVGSIPNSGGQYAAPQSVSQAYPGDVQSSSRTGAYDPASTGSVARTVSSSDNLLGSQRQVARGQLPAVSRMPATVVGSSDRNSPDLTTASIAQPRAAVPSSAVRQKPVSVPHVAGTPQQPFPGDVAGNTLAPDPIITGTAPRTAGWNATGGSRITLGEGETVSSVSRRYGVPINEIMKANGLADASKVRAGQQLLIPVYVYGSSKSAQGQTPANPTAPNRAPAQDVAVLPTLPTQRDAKPTSTASAANATPKQAAGVHVVQSGDTLTKIANANGVSIDALKAANGLTTASIRIGQKLNIPGGSSTGTAPDPVQTASVKPSVQAAASTAPAPKVYTAPAASAGKDKLTETAKAVSAEAPAGTGIGKLRWPGRGQVITGFAKSEDGRRNDGIDISMPVGTAVKAAENGVVIYSGDGLKEYGNTVLIRHDNGLVTVYAHAESLKVNRGDKVQRGQTIASSGMSGVAKTPRLHFEVRKDATPVDPSSFLE
ncbi:peptidoglycan DD-metalloendopeptidase family protein [Hoeflea marina]|uniref:peptidoglycan DD-metalloendopeptidase family protein n=1 Tax=Hoeflea marina TaxID=274592 RepID=UPI001FDFA1C1|nr:peptidoglycan DD-metalloendopeptidase family protein [Hoeflea marina]